MSYDDIMLAGMILALLLVAQAMGLLLWMLVALAATYGLAKILRYL